ncbi:hypothetical protein LCGC14_0859800 [marine sediment metagenome]|uniref:Uncharacterized protein n=1 Tax=marine sediment metagenome TaxID=412755 RepID=A0A0F9P7P5_9ZZZZ
MGALRTLEMLHWIEEHSIIYNIHWCRAGVGIIFYEGLGAMEEENWRKSLAVHRYYPSFEECVKAEYQRLEVAA